MELHVYIDKKEQGHREEMRRILSKQSCKIYSGNTGTDGKRDTAALSLETDAERDTHRKF